MRIALVVPDPMGQIPFFTPIDIPEAEFKSITHINILVNGTKYEVVPNKEKLLWNPELTWYIDGKNDAIGMMVVNTSFVDEFLDESTKIQVNNMFMEDDHWFFYEY